MSPDGATVYVTGDSQSGPGPSTRDYLTVAYDAATGDELWTARYNGPGDDQDIALAVHAAADGASVYVTGESGGEGTGSDYATVAYDAATGDELWVGRYDGPAGDDDVAHDVDMSPDGSSVYVTGQSGGDTGPGYATVAYDAGTGDEVWEARLDDPRGERGSGNALGVAPDGVIFVTGQSSNPTAGSDIVTVAYDPEGGDRLWLGRYDGSSFGSFDAGTALGVSPDGDRVRARKAVRR